MTLEALESVSSCRCFVAGNGVDDVVDVRPLEGSYIGCQLMRISTNTLRYANTAVQGSACIEL